MARSKAPPKVVKGNPRKDGTFLWHVEVRGPAPDYKRSKLPGHALKRDADAQKLRIERDEAEQREHGSGPLPPGYTLAQLRDDYINSKPRGRLNQRRAKTKENMRGHFNGYILPYFEARKISTASAMHMTDGLAFQSALLASPRIKDGMRRQVWLTFSAAANWWFGLHRRPDLSPAFGLSPITYTAARRQVPTLEELQPMFTFIMSDRPALAAPIMFACYCGLRVGEILNLRWRSTDLRSLRVEANEEWEPKTDGQDHERVLLKDARELLETLRASEPQPLRPQVNDWVFNDHGAKITPGKLGYYWRKVRAQFGFPPELHMHDLRHLFASRALGSGMDLGVVSALVGHASPVITQGVYRHVLKGRMEAEVERLDNLWENSGTQLAPKVLDSGAI